MDWRDELIQRLAENPCCGYSRSDVFATEPAALAALALAGAGHGQAAEQVGKQLVEIQNPNGSVAVRLGELEPCWTTSLAVLTWLAAHDKGTGRENFAEPARAGVQWILGHRAFTFPREPGPGHDRSLEAWPWVEGTHSWIEPSAFHVLALKAAGLHKHWRTREAVKMLIDRQLPGGGCNYGNTYVLGRKQRPHIQPTGIALLALAHERAAPPCIRQTIRFLQRSISAQTATTSLSWALLALSAHAASPPEADQWLELAFRRTLQRDQSPLKLALIALAIQKQNALILKLPSGSQADGQIAATSLPRNELAKSNLLSH